MKTMMLYNLTMLKRNALSYGLSCIFVIVVLMATVQNGADISDTLFGITVFLLVYLSLLLVTTISLDRYDHGLNQIFLLPISRKEYVISKYMMVYGCTMILVVGALSVLGFTKQINGDQIMLLVAVGCIAPILCAIQIPIYFKFDLSKARFIAMAVYAVLFLLVFIPMKFLSSIEIDFDVIRSVVTTTPWIPLFMVLTITVIINLISMGISFKLIQTIQD